MKAQTLDRARWGPLALLGLVIALQSVAPELSHRWIHGAHAPGDLRPIAAVWLLWTCVALATRLWPTSPGAPQPAWLAAGLALDIGFLSVCLWLLGPSGAPWRPFYLVSLGLTWLMPLPWAAALLSSGAIGLAWVTASQTIAPGLDDLGTAPPILGPWIGLLAAAVTLGAALRTQNTRSSAPRPATARPATAILTPQRPEVDVQDQHLAALGTLAAGAAHELGTPLNTVHLLAAELPHMSEAERATAIDTIVREVERCRDILQRMASPEIRVSALSTRDAQPWKLAELEEEIDEPQDVALTVDMTEATRTGAGVTTLARSALGQILRELVTNAAEACRRRPGSTGIKVHIDVDGSDGIVTVEDDGEGMPAQVAAAAFEPFFSTKAEGQGMGLGLYLAQAHLRQLGGQFTVNSAPGKGTRIRIRIPLRPTPTPRG